MCKKIITNGLKPLPNELYMKDKIMKFLSLLMIFNALTIGAFAGSQGEAKTYELTQLLITRGSWANFDGINCIRTGENFSFVLNSRKNEIFLRYISNCVKKPNGERGHLLNSSIQTNLSYGVHQLSSVCSIDTIDVERDLNLLSTDKVIFFVEENKNVTCDEGRVGISTYVQILE